MVGYWGTVGGIFHLYVYIICVWFCGRRYSREEEIEEVSCNYERFRALVLNTFKNVPDSEALAKIDVDEMYPAATALKDKKAKLKLVTVWVHVSPLFVPLSPC